MIKETHTATAYNSLALSGSYNLTYPTITKGYKVPVPRSGIMLPPKGSDKYGWRCALLMDEFESPHTKFNKGDISLSGRLKVAFKAPAPKTLEYLLSTFKNNNISEPLQQGSEYENMEPLKLLDLLKKSTTDPAELNRYTHLTNYFTRAELVKTQRPLTQDESALFKTTMEALQDEALQLINPATIPPVANVQGAPPPLPAIQHIEINIMMASYLKVNELYTQQIIDDQTHTDFYTNYFTPLSIELTAIEAEIKLIANPQDVIAVNKHIKKVNKGIFALRDEISNIVVGINPSVNIHISGAKGAYNPKRDKDIDIQTISSCFDETLTRQAELRHSIKDLKMFSTKLSANAQNTRDEILSNLDPANNIRFDRKTPLTPDYFLNTYLSAGNRTDKVEASRFYILFNDNKNKMGDLLHIAKTATLPHTFITTQIS